MRSVCAPFRASFPLVASLHHLSSYHITVNVHVVLMSVCRIIFSCTAIGVPTCLAMTYMCGGEREC